MVYNVFTIRARGQSRKKAKNSFDKTPVADDPLVTAITQMMTKKESRLEGMGEILKQNADVDRERGLVALLSEYDTAIKANVADLDGFASDMEDEKQGATAVVAMLKRKRSDVIKNLIDFEDT